MLCRLELQQHSTRRLRRTW